MRLTIALLVSLWFSQSPSAAPVPKNAKRMDYFPLGVGSVWVYIEGDNEITTKIIASDSEKSAQMITLTYTGSKVQPPTARRVFKFLDDNIYSLKTETAEADKPGLIMKRVIRPGDSWTTEHRWTGGTLWTISFKVGDAKKIKTPAGEFLALPVEQESSNFGKELRWYANGIGLIRKEKDGEVISELKSFEPGK